MQPLTLREDRLLPDLLQDLGLELQAGRIDGHQYYEREQEYKDRYRKIWREGLLLPDRSDLRDSLLFELGTYLGIDDLPEVERRCRKAARSVEEEWHERVAEGNDETVIAFYDQSEAYLFDLTWWHTLIEDDTPLCYVTALQFAHNHNCRRYLDFGSGIGSGTVLFGRYGFEVTAADVSSSLLAFTQWRLQRREQPAQLIDLKNQNIPSDHFDLVTAMDVFEHLVDPCGALEQILDALKPGGYFYGRIGAEQGDERPQHIVRDFTPVYAHLKRLGLNLVWEDWMYGHQVYQKPGA